MENSTVKGEDISIKFKVKDSNLIPEDEELFNHWFISAEEKEKTYNNGSSGQ